MMGHAAVDIQQILSEVEQHLARIRAVFNVGKLLEEWKPDDITLYFDKSELAYRLLHSSGGAVHMALNYDGVFDKKGYYEQANIVSDIISRLNKAHVLELAVGKGFNIRYLARRHSNVSFWGIDITPKHIQIARKSSRNLPNLKLLVGDFHSLPFPDKYFDVVYEVEGVCYATDTEAVFKEVYRTLRIGGYFILFDGFRREGFDKLPALLKEAAVLVERSMAVKEGRVVTYVLDTASSVGFKLERVSDLSYAVMPNMLRFQRWADRYFRHLRLARVVANIFPRKLLYNAIAGLLMPYTVQGGAHGYYMLMLRKI